jgi:hypothetical protein
MTHYYKDGKWSKPGVTSIIADSHDKSGPLTQWAANMVVKWIHQNVGQEEIGIFPVTDEHLEKARFNYREVSQTALDIGSEVHHAIEIWLQTKQEPINPKDEVLSAFVAFLEFYDEHEMEPIKLEHSVIGDYWGGTLDYYGWFDGKLYVIDFKSSKGHYIHEHGPQIAAYRSEVKEPCDGCAVLRLDKTTGYPDFKDYSKRWKKDLKEFKLMVPLYMHRHPRIAKAAGWKEN